MKEVGVQSYLGNCCDKETLQYKTKHSAEIRDNHCGTIFSYGQQLRNK